jgi:hypothetical protein
VLPGLWAGSTDRCYPGPAMMDDSARLRLAGEAAEVLEQMGFTAVGRLKAGAVWLELWRDGMAMRYELSSAEVSPRALADACVREFELRVRES